MHANEHARETRELLNLSFVRVCRVYAWCVRNLLVVVIS